MKLLGSQTSGAQLDATAFEKLRVLRKNVEVQGHDLDLEVRLKRGRPRGEQLTATESDKARSARSLFHFRKSFSEQELAAVIKDQGRLHIILIDEARDVNTLGKTLA